MSIGAKDTIPQQIKHRPPHKLALFIRPKVGLQHMFQHRGVRKIHNPPHKWQRNGKHSSDLIMDLLVQLGDFGSRLESHFDDVSDEG